MNKNHLLKFINPVIGILLIAQMGSGLFHDFIPQELFEEIHEIGGYIFGILLLAHVWLNWNWIVNNLVKNKKRKQAVHMEKVIDTVSSNN